MEVNNAVVVQVPGENGPENPEQNPGGNGNGRVNQIELLPLENQNLPLQNP